MGIPAMAFAEFTSKLSEQTQKAIAKMKQNEEDTTAAEASLEHLRKLQKIGTNGPITVATKKRLKRTSFASRRRTRRRRRRSRRRSDGVQDRRRQAGAGHAAGDAGRSATRPSGKVKTPVG